jgi:hypothetical protein
LAAAGDVARSVTSMQTCGKRRRRIRRSYRRLCSSL